MNNVPVCPYCRSISVKEHSCHRGHTWEGTWEEELSRLRQVARSRNPGIEGMAGQDIEMKFNGGRVYSNEG